MFKLLTLLLLVVSSVSMSSPKVVYLETSSVEVWQNTYKHDAYQPHLTDKWSQGGAFNLGIRFPQNIIWNNRLHLDGTSSKVERAGWEFSVKYDRFQLRPFYYHHSEHSLEHMGESGRFPQTDKLGLELCLLGC